MGERITFLPSTVVKAGDYLIPDLRLSVAPSVPLFAHNVPERFRIVPYGYGSHGTPGVDEDRPQKLDGVFFGGWLNLEAVGGIRLFPITRNEDLRLEAGFGFMPGIVENGEQYGYPHEGESYVVSRLDKGKGIVYGSNLVLRHKIKSAAIDFGFGVSKSTLAAWRGWYRWSHYDVYKEETDDAVDFRVFSRFGGFGVGEEDGFNLGFSYDLGYGLTVATFGQDTVFIQGPFFGISCGTYWFSN